MTAVPPPYDRQASFTGFSTEQGPTVGQNLEAEFNKIKQVSDATQARLAEIQRDDGKLANQSVHPDALSSGVRVLLGAAGGEVRGAWGTGAVYQQKDLVVAPSGAAYLAVIEHLSGADFDVDLTAGKWIPIDTAAATDAALRDDILDGAIEGPLRDDLKVIYGPSFTADFGGNGNNIADNVAAFAAAEASAYSRIYLPSGTYYTTSSAFALTKYYYGPGQIRFSAGTRAPGRFTWLTSRPATGSGSDFDKFFSADLSKVDASLFTLGGSGANLRKSLTEPYFESCTTPHFNAFINWSGWSGVSARLTVAASAGAGSVTVNSAAGITNGQSLGFSASTGDPATQSVAETVTVTGVVGNVISFTPNLANAYSIGARVTLGTRTMNPLEYAHVRHFGGGDAYVHVARMDVGYPRTAGQDHFFFTATGSLYGGEVNATTEGVFLNGTEIKLVDNGYAVAGIGDIRNLNRTNATNTLGQRWGGYQVKSEGSQAVDFFYQGIGKSKRGIDFALSDFGADKAAIALKEGDRVYFRASGTPDGAGFTLFGNLVGDCWMEYSTGIGGMNYVIAGESSLQVTNLRMTAMKDFKVVGKVGFNGTDPIAKPALPAAATDAASTQALANAMRTILLNYGLAS